MGEGVPAAGGVAVFDTVEGDTSGALVPADGEAVGEAVGNGGNVGDDVGLTIGETTTMAGVGTSSDVGLGALRSATPAATATKASTARKATSKP